MLNVKICKNIQLNPYLIAFSYINHSNNVCDDHDIKIKLLNCVFKEYFKSFISFGKSYET